MKLICAPDATLRPSLHQNSGIGLIELIICLAIIAFLFAYSAPKLSDRIEFARTKSELNKIYQAIQLGRGLAIKKSQTITLCASENSKTCENDWNLGLILFQDKNNNRSVDGNESVLHHFAKSNHQGRLFWRASFGRSFLRFHKDGSVKENGSFTYCPSNNKMAHSGQVTVNSAGRAYILYAKKQEGITKTKRKDFPC